MITLKFKKMKRISSFTCLITIVILFYSCSDKYQLIGKWDDNIKLSSKTAEFKASTDSVTIKTGGSQWWITDIRVDDNYFYDFSSIDQQADNYSLKQDFLNIERRDRHTLFIKAGANPNNVKRIIIVELQAGDYFDNVTITQTAK
jgi:hypothetical protein